MISIIICSVQPDYLLRLKENISATIGVPFEILAVDNRNTANGICQVYNAAAAQASYDVLCFVHEDVCFHTADWGKQLQVILAEPANGLVGVSGTVYKSKFPASWVACRQEFYRIHTIQHFRDKVDPVHSAINPDNETISEVAVIDGVLMACRKATWQQYPFDEKMLTGFHGYDLDWSLSIGQTHRILVAHTILLEHFSEGSFNQEWMEASVALHQKWKQSLPRSKRSGKPLVDRFSDYLACSFVLQQLLKNGSSKTELLRYYLQCIFLFFGYNRFRYTKAVARHLFSKHAIQQKR